MTQIRQFIIQICWSQTDHEMFLVHAESKEDAIKKAKERFSSAYHWNYYGEIVGEIK